MFSTARVACKNWHPDTTSGTYLPPNTREASYAIFPISVPQNGSVAQEAPNLLNQAKVCHLEPIEKFACGMSQ